MGAKDEPDTREGAAEGVRDVQEAGEEDGKEGSCPSQEARASEQGSSEKGSGKSPGESCREGSRQETCWQGRGGTPWPPWQARSARSA